MRISIVTTLYQSADYIQEFYERSLKAIQTLGVDYQFVFVNDGSPDNVLTLALQISSRDKNVLVIDLSRNFGHHKAAMTGLEYADGDLVFMIDVDLEEEPELLITFFEKLVSEQVDVIYGVQERRKGKFVERFFGGLFYKLINLLSSVKIPENVLMARLMTRRYVDALGLHKESQFDISSLWELTGFEQIPVAVKKHANSKTSYTFAKRFSALMRGLVSSTNRPLILIGVLGLLILLAASCYFVYLMCVYIFVGTPPDGFTTLVLSLWFLGGLTIFCLGVISMYLSVIFIETKNRPYSIVKEIYCSANESGSGELNRDTKSNSEKIGDESFTS